MKNLLDTLKNNNQDFEFYPTTSKMISDIVNHIGSYNFEKGTILDIGAGNGNFFTKLSKMCDTTYLKKFAIEKSQILINQMPNDIIVVGADFYQQTLIDKDFDLIFCNPPYSEFKAWIEKVISETNCNKVIFIVPERWQEDSSLVELVKKRGFEYKIVSSDDFLDGERQARAKINIIYFTRHRQKYYCDLNQSFVDFFQENFSALKTKEAEIKIDKRMENELVAGNNLIERMCSLYTLEFKSLMDSFTAISKIDDKTLENIGINRSKVMGALSNRIAKLKNEYWMHLIHNLKEVKERLIYKFREALITSITFAIGNIDFNEENCYAILIWIIKNANKSMNEQLLFMFDLCIEPENIKKYKSNKLVFETEDRGWGKREDIRFKNKKEIKDITLDYRIITNSRSYQIRNYYNENEEEHNIINSWEVICNNLLGHTNFGEIKFFKNGNVHLKFNVEFSKAFNVQASLLKGWIKDKRQAVNEFEMDIKEEDLNFNYFHFNNKNQLLIE